MSYREFLAKHADLSKLPAVITGVGGRRVKLIEAEMPDLLAYQAQLERRIARQERRQRRGR